MEIIISIIIIWLTLGALHLPLTKYWWTDVLDYTKEDQRFVRWAVLLGPFALISGMILVLPLFLKPRFEDRTIITKRRTK